MKKVFQVQSSNSKTIDIDEALELAERTGVLKVPQEALFLRVEGGQVEVKENE